MVYRKHICIEGLIGAGKSSIAAELENVLDSKWQYVREPQLEKEGLKQLTAYYNDIKNRCLPFQTYLLYERKKQLNEVMQKHAILDRCLLFDKAFAMKAHNEGILSDGEYESYMIMNHNVTDGYKVDTLFYIDVTPETSLYRIHERNRPCERGITLEYLQGLDDAYKTTLFAAENLGLYKRIFFVDGERPLTAIMDEIKNVLKLHNIH